MIKGIGFEHYKAFTRGEISPKPITLILGANSCGKSSLLQLFLLFAQSHGRVPPDTPLQLNGERTSFGNALNVIQGRDPQQRLKFSFRINPVEAFPISQLTILFRRVLMEYMQSTRHQKVPVEEREKFQALLKTFGELTAAKTNETADKTRGLIGGLLVLLERAKLRSERNRETLINSPVSKGKEKDVSEIVKTSERLLGSNQNYGQMIDALKLLSKADEWPEINEVVYVFYYNNTTHQLDVQSLSLRKGDVNILEYVRKRGNGRLVREVKSEVFDNQLLSKYKKHFSKFLEFSGLELVSSGEDLTKSLDNYGFVGLVSSLFNRATREVSSEFESGKIKHVSPLRAFPQRYYLMDRDFGRASLDTRDGASLADVLQKKTSVRDRVNKWLENFGLSVNVASVKDVIHSIKIHQNELDLDLTDVGFGISQVLPVIVQGFLAEKDSFTLIEQPEIHLHPKMQADLADLFIDITKTTKSRLIIETHSEYLLKRLRRRIAEGHIRSEEVAIYVVHPPGDSVASSIIEALDIEKGGGFVWPKDFIDVELDDTLAFARLQDVDQISDRPIYFKAD